MRLEIEVLISTTIFHYRNLKFQKHIYLLLSTIHFTICFTSFHWFRQIRSVLYFFLTELKNWTPNQILNTNYTSANWLVCCDFKTMCIIILRREVLLSHWKRTHEQWASSFCKLMVYSYIDIWQDSDIL